MRQSILDSRFILAVSSVVIVAFSGVSRDANAATLTWTGGTGTWDQSAGNTPWSGSAWTDGSDAAFAAAAGNSNNSTVGTQTITVTANVAPLSMTLNSGQGAFRFTTANGSVISNTGAATTNWTRGTSNKGTYADFATAGLLNFTNAPTGSVSGAGSTAILNGATLGTNDFILAQAGTLAAPTYANAASALTASGNNLIAGSFTDTGPTTINSLKFDATTGRALAIGNTLTITSGMILTQAGTTESITGNKTITPSNGELELISNGNLVLNANIGSGNSITKSGAGTVFATGTSTSTTGALRILEGTYQFGNNTGGGETTAVSSVVIGNGAQLNVRHANGDFTFDRNMSGSGNFQLNYTGSTSASTYTLSGTNGNLLGGTTVNTAVGNNTTAFNVTLKAGSATAFGSGTLTITSNAATSTAIAAGTPSATIASTADVGGFALTTGLLSDAGYGAASALTNSGANTTLTLSGFGSQSYGGVIVDGAGTLGIAKAGTGTQVLTGNGNTYSGGTSVSNGRLRLSNTSNSATGTGAVSVTAATAAVDGTGSSSGLLTVTNAGIIAPAVNTSGNFGVAGTLGVGTTGGMTLTSAVLDFDLAALASGTSDMITTGGTFTPTAAAFSFNELTVGSLDTAAAYTIVSGFTNAPSLSGITGSVVQGGYTPIFSLNGNALQVTFTPVPEPTTLGLFGLGAVAVVARRRRVNV